MIARHGFREVRLRLLDALHGRRVLHAQRRDRKSKNLLDTGALAHDDVVDIVLGSRGNEHECTPHHRDPAVDVHVVRSGGWYLKFVFAGDFVEFLSVHRSERP